MLEQPGQPKPRLELEEYGVSNSGYEDLGHTLFGEIRAVFGNDKSVEVRRKNGDVILSFERNHDDHGDEIILCSLIEDNRGIFELFNNGSVKQHDPQGMRDDARSKRALAHGELRHIYEILKRTDVDFVYPERQRKEDDSIPKEPGK